MTQIEEEQKYWSALLERIIEVVKFLVERGLAFCGSDEKIGSHNNSNYLGLLELLAKFDPFMAEHIIAHANKGKGDTSYPCRDCGHNCVVCFILKIRLRVRQRYLSKTIREEFISLIKSSAYDNIICELKNSKYYTISLDSTPDISNVSVDFNRTFVLPTEPV